tara:strand:- start:1535 stop:1654 length:120 start_codon:yes stop_codon:yes gene_type:complete
MGHLIALLVEDLYQGCGARDAPNSLRPLLYNIEYVDAID